MGKSPRAPPGLRLLRFFLTPARALYTNSRLESASVAQLAEQLIRNQQVRGSIPRAGSRPPPLHAKAPRSPKGNSWRCRISFFSFARVSSSGSRPRQRSSRHPQSGGHCAMPTMAEQQGIRRGTRPSVQETDSKSLHSISAACMYGYAWTPVFVSWNMSRHWRSKRNGTQYLLGGNGLSPDKAAGIRPQP